MLWGKEYRKAGGYLTVEASLVIPLAVFFNRPYFLYDFLSV